MAVDISIDGNHDFLWLWISALMETMIIFLLNTTRSSYVVGTTYINKLREKHTKTILLLPIILLTRFYDIRKSFS